MGLDGAGGIRRDNNNVYRLFSEGKTPRPSSKTSFQLSEAGSAYQPPELAIPDFDQIDSRWQSALIAGSEMEQVALRNKVTHWLDNTELLALLHASYRAGHRVGNRSDLQESVEEAWYDQTLVPQDKFSVKGLATPYQQRLIARMPHLIRGLRSKIPGIPGQSFMLASYALRDLSSPATAELIIPFVMEVCGYAKTLLRDKGSPENRALAAYMLKLIIPAIPKGHSETVRLANALSNVFKRKITPKDLMETLYEKDVVEALKSFRLLIPKLDQGTPFNRPSEIDESDTELRQMIEDCSTCFLALHLMAVRGIVRATIAKHIMQEIQLQLTKTLKALHNHFSYLNRMGIYNSLISRGKNWLEGAKYEEIIKHLRDEDPATQVLAAETLAESTLYYVQGAIRGYESRLIGSIRALNMLMQRLPIEHPKPVEACAKDIREGRLPDISPDVASGKISDDLLTSGMIVKTTKYKLMQSESVTDMDVSDEFRKMAIRIIPKAVTAYGKMLKKFNRHHPGKGKMIQMGMDNLHRAYWRGISPEIRSAALQAFVSLNSVDSSVTPAEVDKPSTKKATRVEIGARAFINSTALGVPNITSKNLGHMIVYQII